MQSILAIPYWLFRPLGGRRTASVSQQGLHFEKLDVSRHPTAGRY